MRQPVSRGIMKTLCFADFLLLEQTQYNDDFSYELCNFDAVNRNFLIAIVIIGMQ